MSRAEQNGVREPRRHTIVVLAENRDGILARLTGLFAARGYAIDSIAVGPVLDTAILRMVVVVHGNEHVIEQVTKQLQKLIEVIKVSNLTDVDHIERETLLVRVAARTAHRAEIVRIAEVFRAKVVDQTPDTYVLEVSGEESKITAVLEQLRPFGIHEAVRTGKIAIVRGVSVRRTTMDSGATGRKHTRHPVGFEVRIPSLSAHSRLRAYDLSRGGMSVRTNSDVAVGATLALEVVHPITGERFPLAAIVRRHIVRPDFRGIGVEFLDVAEADRRRLDDFMSGETSGGPELE